jgi:hypothetical protein
MRADHGRPREHGALTHPCVGHASHALKHRSSALAHLTAGGCAHPSHHACGRGTQPHEDLVQDHLHCAQGHPDAHRAQSSPGEHHRGQTGEPSQKNQHNRPWCATPGRHMRYQREDEAHDAQRTRTQPTQQPQSRRPHSQHPRPKLRRP